MWIELNVTSFPFLSGIADDDAEASEDKFGAASYRSGSESYDGLSGSDKGGFAFICINNNNNVVSGGNQTIPEPEPTCEGCFSSLSATEITQFLSE